MSKLEDVPWHDLFEYRDNKLFWKIKPSKSVNVGAEAGYVTPHGYRFIGYQGEQYFTHRIIFQMFHGFCPVQIDHIDTNKLNNKISNLRPATRAENCRNIGLKCTNTSGHKNVHWDKRAKKWIVELRINGKKKFFGSFDDLELATLRAHEVRDKYYRDFARHG